MKHSIHSFCSLNRLVFLLVFAGSVSAHADDPRPADLRKLVTDKLPELELSSAAVAAAAPSTAAPAAAVRGLPANRGLLAPAKSPFSAQGHFRTRDGAAQFVTTEGLAVDFPGQQLPASDVLSAMKVTLKGTRDDAGIEIVEVRSDLIEQYERSVKSALEGPAKERLNASLADLSRNIEAATTATGPEAAQRFADELARIQDDSLEAYVAMSPAEQQREAPVLGAFHREARATRRRLGDKSIYGGNDQYAPLTYKAIYERCVSVGRLLYGRRTVGTVFLIGRDVVMTAGHCLPEGDFDPLDYRVAFERPGAGPLEVLNFPVDSLVFAGGPAKFGTLQIPRLDFAILKLKKNEVTGRSPSEAGLEPLKVAARHPSLKRDDLVYVVGFPLGGNQTVADYARVFIPFENSAKAHAAYQIELADEIARLRVDGASPAAHSPAYVETLERDLKQRFDRSFQRNAAGTTSPYYFVSALLEDPPQPAIAFDSDTFHGDSGAPVFLRTQAEVIGLFIRGSPDVNDLKVGWQHHEEAIPIHFLLDYWESNRNGALVQYGVNIASAGGAAIPAAQASAVIQP